MGKKSAKKLPQNSWVVEVEAIVKKVLVVVECTEQEAANDPFSHAISEDDLEMKDWKVISVTPNK